MSIVQISKIQQRAGNLVDLPQLDNAEFGWAEDSKRLFIGKTSPNENVEVLTSYSNIYFSQINGSYGNLNINPTTLMKGEILAFDGTNWINAGGSAGGNINLGNVSNLSISGGAIGYVLQTDGLGNLSWTPKSTLVAYIENVTKATPAVVTTTQNHNLTNGASITITGAQGMTQLNGQQYYANVLTSTTFALYTDSAATANAVNSTAYNAYAYTSVTGTTTSTNYVTVGNSAVLSVNQPVQFLGNMSTSGIVNNTTYYINSIANATSITVSANVYSNGVAGPVMALQTTTGLTANVYETGGQLTSLVSGGGGSGSAAGTNTQVQFNNTNVLGGSSSLTFDFANNILTVGNLTSNVVTGNGLVTATGIVTANTFTSTVGNGTAPMAVNSTTKVTNLNADLVDGYNTSITSSANTIVIRDANGNVYGNVLSSNALSISANANVGNIGATNANITSMTASGNVTAGNISGGNLVTANYFTGTFANGTSNVNIPATNGNINLTAGGTTSLVVTSTGANITGTANVTGNANVGNIGANNAVFTLITGTLVTNSQPNITGVGTLTSGTWNANIIGASYIATLNQNTTGYAATVSNASQPNITGVGTLTSGTWNANIIGASYIATLNQNTTGYSATVSANAQPNITSVGNLTSLIVGNATANVVIGNGTITLSGNINAGNIIGNVVAGSNPISTNANVTGGNIISTGHVVYSVASGISAAGATQGTAYSLTNDFNVVSTVSSGANGVTLPTAVAGYRITVINSSANTLNVYPLGNGVINTQSANVAYSHPAGARLDYLCVATSTAPGGQWYTLNATYG